MQYETTLRRAHLHTMREQFSGSLRSRLAARCCSPSADTTMVSRRLSRTAAKRKIGRPTSKATYDQVGHHLRHHFSHRGNFRIYRNRRRKCGYRETSVRCCTHHLSDFPSAGALRRKEAFGVTAPATTTRIRAARSGMTGEVTVRRTAIGPSILRHCPRHTFSCGESPFADVFDACHYPRLRDVSTKRLTQPPQIIRQGLPIQAASATRSGYLAAVRLPTRLCQRERAQLCRVLARGCRRSTYAPYVACLDLRSQRSCVAVANTAAGLAQRPATLTTFRHF
jgi:hypothetical protein